MILTDEEIIDLFPDQDNGDGDIQYGRAIEAAVIAKLNSAEPVFIVFDGPPDHISPRFVEVETAAITS